MFVRARTIFYKLRMSWGLAAFLAFALLTIVTAPSHACNGNADDAGLASQQVAADIEASTPAIPIYLSAASDQGCCTGASHANACANGSCAPCAAALVVIAGVIDPPVTATHALPAPDTPMRTAPGRNFRPPRSPA